MSTEQIKLDILGKTLTVGTQSDKREMLLHAAQLLNQKIQMIQEAVPNMSSEKLAIMAALNLTHDLLEQNEQIKAQTSAQSLQNQAINDKIRALIQACDEITL